MKKIITLLFVLLMLISMTGCKKKEEPKEEVDTSKHYEIKIIDNNAAESGANIATESEVLSAVLEEIAKIGMLKYETEKGDDGWYISSVNDVKADDKGNWAVYLNNELCKQGIDKVTLKDGDLIEIVYLGHELLDFITAKCKTKCIVIAVNRDIYCSRVVKTRTKSVICSVGN